MNEEDCPDRWTVFFYIAAMLRRIWAVAGRNRGEGKNEQRRQELLSCSRRCFI